MPFLACSWVIGGVAAVSAAAECEPFPAAFNEASKGLISEYWVVVVAASWSRAAPLFLAAEERLSKWPSKCAIISSEERGMAGLRPVGDWVGDAAEMPWAAMDRLVEPKELPL